ncbi:MAG: hypothetical protein ACOC44_15900 [Promethearchaeia archaeon]
MAGIILNFGDVGHLFTNGNYEIRFLNGLTDPDFVHWTFGGYPQKASKAHLADLEVGDFIFFTTKLLHQKSQDKLTYFVGYLQIREIVRVSELLKTYGRKQLWVIHPYCYNTHIHNLLNSEKSPKSRTKECVLFVGDLATSKFIESEPILLDRELFQELFSLFDPDTSPDNGDFNWYYNEPGYADTFGTRKDKNGELLSDERMINAKFRNPPYIPANLVAYLKHLLDKKDEADDLLIRLGHKYGWRHWYNSYFEELLELPRKTWKNLPKKSIEDLLEILPDDLAYTLISDLVAKDLDSEFRRYLIRKQENLKWKIHEFHF